MIGGGRTNAMASHRPLRKFFCQLDPLPILDAGPSGPDRGGGMRLIGPPPAFLPRQQRGYARGIYDPSRRNIFRLLLGADLEDLLAACRQVNFADARRPPNDCAEGLRPAQHLFIQDRPIDLEPRHSGEVLAANFTAIAERFRPGIEKPVTQPLLY